MRGLDCEEREAMSHAIAASNGPCSKCGAPTRVENETFPTALVGALRRCAARGLVRFERCGDSFDLHFDATPMGRTLFVLCTSTLETVG